MTSSSSTCEITRSISHPSQSLDVNNSQAANSESLLSAMGNEIMSAIAHKVIQGLRLSFEEGVYLFKQAPLESLRLLADYRRRELCGDKVLYATTLFVHPTNLCELSCPMCSFYAKPGWKSAWFLQPEQIQELVAQNINKGITEVHIVGGLWKEANLSYYQQTFELIHKINPNLHIKALTPVEYDFLGRLHHMDVRQVLSQMKAWGLGSLPGGGAEILVEEIRKQIAPQKITSERYLEIHRIAHQIGLPSNITMLYGHVEDPQHIVMHLMKVRELQDATGGLRTFVPLKYHIENNALGKRLGRIKPKSNPRVYAISRLMLDNIPNIKVLWNYLGIDEALSMLDYGGNDLGSTALEEKIIKMAGGIDVKMSPEGMSELIRSRSRIPHHCHSGIHL